MNGFLERLKDMMLGTENEDAYAEEEYDAAEYDESERAEEPARGYARAPRETRERERETRERDPELDYIGARKSSGKSSKIVDFHNTQTQQKIQVIITHPTEVQDATIICDYVRDNKACVVNLEGVDRPKAQRIADFLGGASFALGGEIQRISNEIFMIAPASFQITGDIKDEIKSGGHVLSWAASFR